MIFLIVWYILCSHIKAASPKLMMIFFFGLLISLPYPILFGFSLSIEHYGLSKDTADIFCIVRKKCLLLQAILRCSFEFTG